MVAWWGSVRKTSKLLQFEVEVMKRAYGDTFQLELVGWEDKTGRVEKRISWLGTVHINIEAPTTRASTYCRLCIRQSIPALRRKRILCGH